MSNNDILDMYIYEPKAAASTATKPPSISMEKWKENVTTSIPMIIRTSTHKNISMNTPILTNMRIAIITPTIHSTTSNTSSLI